MAVIIIILVLALLFMREMANGRHVGTGGTLLVLLVIAVLIIVGVKSCSSDDDTPSKSTRSSYSTSYVCRRSGCGKSPVYTDWNRRFCSEHINDTSYCRHPDCMNPVPHTSTSQYCAEHR